MDHVATYYLTGQEMRPDGTIEHLPPHEYGALVLEYEHLEDFVPAEDEAAIRPVLREHLYEDKSAEKLQLKAKLNARQKAEAAQLMDSSTPTKTWAMLAAANEASSRRWRPVAAREVEDDDDAGLPAARAKRIILFHRQRRCGWRVNCPASTLTGSAGQPGACRIWIWMVRSLELGSVEDGAFFCFGDA